MKEYNNSFPDTTVMEQEIKEFMSKFDEALQKTEQSIKQSAEQTEDGWVTVTKK